MLEEETSDAAMISRRLSITTMKYIVWGPDGIPIKEKPFDTKNDADRALDAFVDRFRSQGYYAGVGYHLQIDEIAGRCRIEEVASGRKPRR